MGFAAGVLIEVPLRSAAAEQITERQRSDIETVDGLVDRESRFGHGALGQVVASVIDGALRLSAEFEGVVVATGGARKLWHGVVARHVRAILPEGRRRAEWV